MTTAEFTPYGDLLTAVVTQAWRDVRNASTMPKDQADAVNFLLWARATFGESRNVKKRQEYTTEWQ